MSSQPSRLVTSGVPSGAQTVPSLAQTRPTMSSSTACSTRLRITPSSSSGMLDSKVVGRTGVGQARLALQVLAAELLQPLVDLGVHARDEERRDGVHLERLPALLAALEALDEGFGDRRVCLDAEQQRHVDVDPVGDRLL